MIVDEQLLPRLRHTGNRELDKGLDAAIVQYFRDTLRTTLRFALDASEDALADMAQCCQQVPLSHRQLRERGQILELRDFLTDVQQTLPAEGEAFDPVRLADLHRELQFLEIMCPSKSGDPANRINRYL